MCHSFPEPRLGSVSEDQLLGTDTQLLASLGPAQMDGFAIIHTSQQPFLHYWKLPPIVPKAEFNLQFPQ